MGLSQWVIGRKGGKLDRVKPTVVIIDDDREFRFSASALLRLRGYQVVGEAGTVSDALEPLSISQPDLVLLDIHLPDGDGLSVAARLTSEYGPSRPRVVLISSDPSAASQRLVRSSGAAGFIAKENLGAASVDDLLAG
jgi:DNA-binding NarL/FixJ family response regulator